MLVGVGKDRAIHFFELAGETVWGATARVLVGFLAHVNAFVAERRECPARPGYPDPLHPTGSRAAVEVEIGIGKSGRRAYGFDDIAIVPSRRTRDPEDVDISWEIDAFHFELPLVASAMDGVVSPTTAIEIGRLGGLGCLNLEGLWTRYEDPEPLLRGDRHARRREGHRRMQEIYNEPIKDELVGRRIAEIKAGGSHHVRVAHTRSASSSTLEGPARRRARSARGAGDGRVGRARVEGRRAPAAQPQEVHPRVRDPRHRRRLRVVLHGAAPHAHRRGRRARRVSVRATRARAAACSASACRRPPRSPTPRAPASVTSTRPASTCT